MLNTRLFFHMIEKSVTFLVLVADHHSISSMYMLSIHPSMKTQRFNRKMEGANKILLKL